MATDWSYVLCLIGCFYKLLAIGRNSNGYWLKRLWLLIDSPLALLSALLVIGWSAIPNTTGCCLEFHLLLAETPTWFFFHFKKKPTYDGFVIGLKRGDGLSDATGSVGDRSWVDTRRIRRRANVLQLGSHSRAVDKAGESVDVQHYGHRVHQLGERQLLTPTRGLIPACQSVDVVLTWGTKTHTHTHTLFCIQKCDFIFCFIHSPQWSSRVNAPDCDWVVLIGASAGAPGQGPPTTCSRHRLGGSSAQTSTPTAASASPRQPKTHGEKKKKANAWNRFSEITCSAHLSSPFNWCLFCWCFNLWPKERRRRRWWWPWLKSTNQRWKKVCVK